MHLYNWRRITWRIWTSAYPKVQRGTRPAEMSTGVVTFSKHIFIYESSQKIKIIFHVFTSHSTLCSVLRLRPHVFEGAGKSAIFPVPEPSGKFGAYIEGERSEFFQVPEPMRKRQLEEWHLAASPTGCIWRRRKLGILVPGPIYIQGQSSEFFQISRIFSRMWRYQLSEGGGAAQKFLF